MKILNPERPHIPHLIIQPTFKCIAKCERCYLASSTFLEEDSTLLSEALKALQEDSIQVDQVTLSVDFNPSEKGRWCFSELLLERSTELWMTLRNEVSALSWFEYLEAAGLPLSRLDAISLSNSLNPDLLDDLQENYISKFGWQLNYNYLVNGEAPKPWLSAAADSIYCILQKPRLGDEITEGVFQYYFQAAQHMRRNYGQKVSHDRCICAGEEEVCHAGIHTATIWPDGSWTGCPYDSTGIGAVTRGSAVERAHGMHQVHSPFRNCRIREAIRCPD